MCKCNPSIRTPFCGKADCVPSWSALATPKLTPNQKWQVICSLVAASIKMDLNGVWYVEQSGVWIRDRAIQRGIAGRGNTPYEAIDDHFQMLTDVPDGMHVEYNKSHYVWNGFMWKVEY